MASTLGGGNLCQHRFRTLFSLITWICLATLAYGAAYDPAMVSQHQCLPVAPGQHPENTICKYQDLVLYNGQLYYVSPTALTLPTVNMDFWLGGTLDVKVVAPNELPFPATAATMEIADSALVFMVRQDVRIPPCRLSGSRSCCNCAGCLLILWCLHVQVFYHNYYHALAEYAPSLHSVLCSQLGYCTYEPTKEFWVMMTNPVKPEHEGVAPQAVQESFQALTNHPVRSFAVTISTVVSLPVHSTNCLAALPASLLITKLNATLQVVHIAHEELQDTVVILTRTIAGWGPQCRADHHHCDRTVRHSPP